MLHRTRFQAVRTRETQVQLETLEPRIVLTGYFAVGIQYDTTSEIFNEFGDYDSGTGAVNFGSRETSGSGFSSTPYSSFGFGDANNHYQGAIQYDAPDLFELNRVTVGFGGPIKMGFSVGYSGNNYQTPIQVNYLMNQATGLGTGSGGRDGDYFFNGVVRDVNADTWSFNYGMTNISGLDVTGSQNHESGEVPFSYRLSGSGIFADGFTEMSDSTSVLFFGDALGAVQQTDLDGSDGFQSYSLGMRVESGTTFTPTHYMGDVYALAMTGSPDLAAFFGQSAGGAGGFTYTGALEFADDSTFRMYDLGSYYEEGRDDADVVLKGTFTTEGDTVQLSTFDGVNTLDLKYNADLSISLPVRYAEDGESHHLYGAGARIRDGATGDFPAAEPDGDNTPATYNFSDVLAVRGADSTSYMIGQTTNGDEIRFDLSLTAALSPSDIVYGVWLAEAGQGLRGIGLVDDEISYITRSATGVWGTTTITSDPLETFASTPSISALPGGGMSVGGFNSNGDVLRLDCLDGIWTVDRLTGIPAPDGEPGTPTDNPFLLVTPWSAWHLLYLDSNESLRVAWTTPSLDTYYDNNLSQRAGLSGVDGMSVHASITSWDAINIGVVDQGELHNVWWQPSFGGNWADTSFDDLLGSDATNLHGGFVGTHFDTSTGDMYNFALPQDESDLFVYRFGTSWARSAAIADLGVSGLALPEAEDLSIRGLNGEGFEVRGKVPGLGDIPILSRFFTNRTESNLDQELIIFVTASLIEPTDEE